MESEKWAKELNSFFVKVTEESEKAGIKLNIQKAKVMTIDHIS